MTDYCYVNGALVPTSDGVVPLADRSYLYGDGLFETMLVRAREACLLREHITRISHSAAAFGYTVPCAALLNAAVNAVISANDLDSGALRLTLSPRRSTSLSLCGEESRTLPRNTSVDLLQ
ncbi:MAG: hypothetical protein DDT38_01569 [Firmicutes bacterium]|nr:hypothetical protein [candidate division NPL-UPA2 bacterium]